MQVSQRNNIFHTNKDLGEEDEIQKNDKMGGAVKAEQYFSARKMTAYMDALLNV